MKTQDLSEFGQEHLLQFVDELDAEQRAVLEKQIAEIDFQALHALTQAEEAGTNWEELASRATPPPAVRLRTPHPDFSAEDAIQAGEAALRAGKIGMILVAGGQGTRLGSDEPKGMFPIGPLSHRTLFQMHCDRVLAVAQRYQVAIPLFVMTSPATDELSRRYFAENDLCGVPAEQLKIFCQGSMPAVDDSTGRVLLAEKGKIALSPNGHGGLLAALDQNGCLEEARSAGIEHFFYAQVDNPLAPLCDPELIGYHLLAQSQMTTQVVEKRFAKEKVGNVVSIDGKVHIIEYSDLPDPAAQRTNDDGSLTLWAGNIAVHVFERQFLESVIDNADDLPFHRAHKKVSFVDSSGTLVEPAAPNAVKFERFVFDLLPMADRAIVVEGHPATVFAPVKNANGADVDTPAHTQAALLAMHRQWLEAAGAKFLEGVQVEIHPQWALDAEETQAKLTGDIEFAANTFLR